MKHRYNMETVCVYLYRFWDNPYKDLLSQANTKFSKGIETKQKNNKTEEGSSRADTNKEKMVCGSKRNWSQIRFNIERCWSSVILPSSCLVFYFK